MFCCSVSQSCLTVGDPMGCSTPGFPVLHCLPEFAQTHVHWVGDAIQPSHHPLLSPSSPAFNLFQLRVFTSESVLPIGWPKYWSFSRRFSPSNEYSWLFEIHWTSRVSESAIRWANEKQETRIQWKARIRGPTLLHGEGAETESKTPLLYFQQWRIEYAWS